MEEDVSQTRKSAFSPAEIEKHCKKSVKTGPGTAPPAEIPPQTASNLAADGAVELPELHARGFQVGGASALWGTASKPKASIIR